MKWPWQKREDEPVDPVAATVRELMRISSKPELAAALVATTRELDQICDILTFTDESTTGTDANAYKSRDARIVALVKAYKGQAKWGGGLIRRLVNIRRAWQMPKGLKAIKAEGYETADAELEYIEEVLDDNNLNEGKGQEAVRQKEIEGQYLIELRWDGRVVLRPRLSRTQEYKVTLVNPKDPNGPKRAQFYKSGMVVETLEDDQFVFVHFNGDGETLQGNPDLGDVLWYCENADRALFAWRKFNSLFAHLTPFFETADAAVADKLQELIKAAGWKIGMSLAANAKMQLVGPSAAPGEMLRQELVANVQLICGLTGVEPQDIGFPDILSNRAVATEMGEPQEIATEADVTIWRGFFEELFRKCIRLRNANLFGQLDENAVVADIKTPTGRMWARVKDVFLPAAVAGVLDRQTFVEHVPDLDVDAVMERLEADDERKAKNALAAFGLNAKDAIGG